MRPLSLLSAVQRLIARLAHDDRGGIAIISCGFFMIGIAASALAVDLGSLYLEKRRAQGITDLAAIAAAGDLAHAEAAARATLTANKIDLTRATLRVELGHYQPDIATAANARFQIGVLPYNAARVTLTKPGQIFFAKTFTDDCCDMTVTAIAASAQIATFSIGSRLAAINGGVINGLMKGLLGGSVNLSVMDYNALIGGNVKLFPFLDALATELNLTAASYDQVLDASATAGTVLKALARVAQANGNTAAVTALNTLAFQSTAAAKPLDLGKLLGLDPRFGNLTVGTHPAGRDANFNIMDVVSAAAVLADGNKQIGVDLGASIPGLAKVSLSVTIGEPMQHAPWAAVGQKGTIIRTSQTKVRLDVEVGVGIVVKLPIDVNVASAEGRLASIACAANGTGSVNVGVKTGIISAFVGGTSSADKVDLATVPVPLLGAIKVTAYTPHAFPANGQNTSEQTVSFTQTEIDNLTTKTVSSTALVSPIAALVSDLKLGAKLGFVDIPVPGLVTSTVGGLLNPVTGTLDALLFQVLATLGIHLGQADVRVNGVRCDGATLTG